MKPKTLPAVRPNLGIQAAYRDRLTREITAMQVELTTAIIDTWGDHPPAMAHDASSAADLRTTVARIGTKWRQRFNTLSAEMAAHFAKATADRVDASLKASLRKAGFAVQFKMTAAQQDAISATTAANVALIRSIPAQHLTAIEGDVMRSIQAGRDLGTLAKALRETYGVTKRRAAFIAMSQNNLATATITRVRQTELGITQARWLHSAGGRHPRPSHIAFSGETYDVATGAFIDGAFIRPGELINCFPAETIVSLKTPIFALWRTLFHGPMVYLQIGPDLLKGTPNHPILTSRGWIPMGQIERGDQVICVAHERGNMVHHDEDDGVTTFGQLFEASAREFGYVSRSGTSFDFHGHRPQHEVDEVVIINQHLATDGPACSGENIGDFLLAEADGLMPPGGIGRPGHASCMSPPGPLRERLLLLHCREREARSHGGATSPHHSPPDEHIPHVSSRMPRYAKPRSYGGGSKPIGVQGDDLISHRVPVSTPIRDNTHGLELLAQLVGVATDVSGGVFEHGSVAYEFRRVSNKGVGDFSGHVFTMQTATGHYSVSGASVQAKNCRCVSVSIVPGFG